MGAFWGPDWVPGWPCSNTSRCSLKRVSLRLSTCKWECCLVLENWLDRLCWVSSIPIPVHQVNTDIMWINQMSICQHTCHLSVPAGQVWISGNLWLLNSEWIIIIMIICNLESKFVLLCFGTASVTSICQATIKVPTSYTGAEVRPAMGQWFYMTCTGYFFVSICHHASQKQYYMGCSMISTFAVCISIFASACCWLWISLS